MAVLVKACLTLVVLVILLCISRSYALYKNYTAARRIGLPIVIALESWQDPFWIILGPLIMPFLTRLGLWNRSKPDLSTFGWPMKDHYAIHAKHGPAFSLATPFKTNILVADSEAARTLFKDWRIWVKNQDLYGMMNSFGKNVNTVNGDDWQRHRKVTAPAFKEANSKLVWKASLAQAEGLTKKWIKQSKHDLIVGVTLEHLREDTETVAMHVLSSAGMGKTYEFEKGLENLEPGHEMSYSVAMKTIISNMSPLLIPLTILATKLPPAVVPKWLSDLRVAVKEMRWNLEDAVNRERQDYRQGGKEKDNLLSTLVRANEVEKGQQGSKKFALDDQELYGNLFMFNQAGHETTSSTLGFAIPFLAAYPDVQNWIREEVDAVLSDVDEQAYAQAFPRLVRCDALMYETLRFFSAVPFHPKYTGNNAQILRIRGREYLIPPHTFVSINYYGMHHNPSTWGPDVERFNPSRFVKSSAQGAGHETFQGAPGDAEHVAWALGPRVCPGKRFSQVEFVAVIASLIKKCELRPALREGESDEAGRKRVLETMFDVDHFISPHTLHPGNAGILCVERT